MPEGETEGAALAAALGHSTQPNSITLKRHGDKEVRSEPLTIDQISEIMLCIDRLTKKGITLPGFETQPKFSATQLALQGGKDFRDILAIATGEDSSFIGKLNLLELAQVAGLVWRVQKDFFVENQIEILKAFGLEDTVVEEIKNLFASIKSLAISLPAESPTSEVSPSDKSKESVAPSSETTAIRSDG